MRLLGLRDKTLGGYRDVVVSLREPLKLEAAFDARQYGGGFVRLITRNRHRGAD